MTDFYKKVYEITAAVPAGKVLTYGALAFLAGKPRAARQAGRAMRMAPSGLPCHRIVGSRGDLAPEEIFGRGRQRRLLEAEKIGFLSDGRVDIAKYLWQP